jgi:EmrB/QacA subfamily drug resistance transporter
MRSPCDEGAIRGAPSVVACSPQASRAVLVATILASSMVFIDGSAVNVALPLIQRDLGTSVTGVQWVIEIYMLLLGALMLAGGALGDRAGRRRVFVWGVSIFTLASVACGLAPGLAALVAARAVQGLGGALLVPGSLAILSASFDEQARGRAIGTWSGATAVTTAAGPVLGGWLAETLSWRWVFLLNVPFAIAVVIASTRVPETRDESVRGGVDWAGTAVSIAGLGALVYGLIESANRGLANWLVLGSIVTGLVLLAVFIRLERHAKAPAMPLDVFRSRAFRGANLLTFLLYGALGSALFFIPFNLIQVFGYSATEAGGAWLPFVLLIGILSRRAGALVARTGSRPLLVAGPLLVAAGFVLAARPETAGSYWTTFFPSFVVLGLGMAIAVAPLVTVVMTAAGPDRAGVASGINNAVSRVAGLVMLAAMGLLVIAVFKVRLDEQLARSRVRPSIASHVDRSRLAAAEPPANATPGEARAIASAVDEAFVSAFRLAMLSSAGLALASALVAWRTIDRQ